MGNSGNLDRKIEAAEGRDYREAKTEGVDL